jgi:hypothetical protein
MDFQIEVGDGVFTDSVPSSSSTPAGANTGEVARAEVAKILSDATHPMHPGLMRGDPAVDRHLDAIYKKAYPGTDVSLREKASIGGPVSTQPGETHDLAADRERNEVILSPLKTEWGPHFEARMSGCRAVARELFGGEGWGEVFDDLGTAIRMHYGPAGKTAALRFLNELAKQKI